MLFLACLLLFILSDFTKASRRGGNLAPYLVPGPNLVPEQYIVRLFENYTLAQHFAHCGANLSQLSLDFEEISLLRSYRAQLDKYTVDHMIRTDPGVEYVEHDTYVIQPTETMNASNNLFTANHSKRDLEHDFMDGYWPSYMVTSKGKVKIKQDPRPSLKSSQKLPHQYSVKVIKNPGAGVNIYVLDHGVRITHKAFQVPSCEVAYYE
ncbi:MAG: hypothetical protein Q9157_000460 [Trypethelium eluteriae]